jgi:hypothetical protein
MPADYQSTAKAKTIFIIQKQRVTTIYAQYQGGRQEITWPFSQFIYGPLCRATA